MYHYEIKPTKRWRGCLTKPLTIAVIVVVLPFFACVIFSFVSLFFTPVTDALPSNSIAAEPEPASPKPTPTWTVDQLIAGPMKVPYSSLARSTESFIGRSVSYQGKVIQVEEGYESYTMLVNVTYSDGFWDDTVLVICNRCDQRILEDDTLFFVGQVDGRFTYETVLGANRTVPQLTILSYGVAD